MRTAAGDVIERPRFEVADDPELDELFQPRRGIEQTDKVEKHPPIEDNSPQTGDIGGLGTSNKPGYTDGTTPGETGGTMGDAREYFALAAKFVEKAYDKGLSVAELGEAIEDKLAAKIGATARETTTRATAAPRRDAMNDLSVDDDTRLGRLGARLKRRMSEIDLPQGGFTTIAQVKRAERLSKTFRDFELARAEVGMPPIEKPESVCKAEAMASAYRRRHDKTGAPVPVRRRGRPRRVAVEGTSSALR